MTPLAQLAIDAVGGLDTWRRFDDVSATLRCGGALWSLKGQAGVLDDVRVRATLRTQWASHEPFGVPTLRTFFARDRVAIETTDGHTVHERLRPRESFTGHRLDTPWDGLHLAYFAGYAMWTYLTTPFVWSDTGVVSREIEPWTEDGETWRRLEVTFPASIATHCPVQIFYIDASGLIRRHDYEADVLGGTPAAHYVHDYSNFCGLLIPTRRRVFARSSDGTPVSDPLIVGIDLTDVVFTLRTDPGFTGCKTPGDLRSVRSDPSHGATQKESA